MLYIYTIYICFVEATFLYYYINKQKVNIYSLNSTDTISNICCRGVSVCAKWQEQQRRHSYAWMRFSSFFTASCHRLSLALYLWMCVSSSHTVVTSVHWHWIAYVILLENSISVLTSIFVSKISHQTHVLTQTHNRYQRTIKCTHTRSTQKQLFHLKHCRAAFVARY